VKVKVMMNCPLKTPENAHLLLDYCARQLELESMSVLERHIAVCSACRNFTSGQRTVWQAMDTWEAAPVSPDFDRLLFRRIEAQVSWWDLLLRPFTTVTLRRGLSAAAMTCLLLVAGILLESPVVSPVPATTGVMQGVVQVDTVQPEQVERALDAMEVLDQFSQHLRAERPGSKL
jgi:hypothetical protein